MIKRANYAIVTGLIVVTFALCTTIDIAAALAQGTCPDGCSLQRQLNLKADNQALQRALSDKADSNDVDRKLTTKADGADVDRKLTGKAETSEVDQKLTAQSAALDRRIHDAIGSVAFNVDRFWVLLAAVLVFFMQAGFKCLEVGMVRPSFDGWQAANKLFAWIMTCVGYYLPGFAIMFGVTHAGLFGGIALPTEVISTLDAALREASRLPIDATVRGMEFFLFQAAFAATAVTIPSGATAERMGVNAYLIVALVISALIYPVFGHWAWGDGWLKAGDFHDFAGSTVVHSVGGWCALVFTLFLGPRPQRFKDGGIVNTADFPSRSRGYAVLGVFMLWFGWWGFNGGSQLKYDTSIANIILNTNLAGAGAGLSAYFFGYLTEHSASPFFHKGFVPEKVIGGVLGGLVAITASCDRASNFQAFFIVGLLAGVVHNLIFDLLLWTKVDDPVGAFPVHAGCGVLGTLLTAFTYNDFSRHLVIQTRGVLAAFVWSFGTAALLCFILRALRLLHRPERIWLIESPGQSAERVQEAN